MCWCAVKKLRTHSLTLFSVVSSVALSGMPFTYLLFCCHSCLSAVLTQWRWGDCPVACIASAQSPFSHSVSCYQERWTSCQSCSEFWSEGGLLFRSRCCWAPVLHNVRRASWWYSRLLLARLGYGCHRMFGRPRLSCHPVLRWALGTERRGRCTTSQSSQVRHSGRPGDCYGATGSPAPPPLSQDCPSLTLAALPLLLHSGSHFSLYFLLLLSYLLFSYSVLVPTVFTIPLG